MIYRYKELIIHLEDDEVYMLKDLLIYALEYDEENNNVNLTDEKRKFAKRLINITDESK